MTEPDFAPPHARLSQALQSLLRPAVGFSHPMDVLKDPWLDDDDKRAVLSSWASDASAVEGQPTLRWLLGTEAPVPLAEVLEALDRLDRRAPQVDLGRLPPGASGYSVVTTISGGRACTRTTEYGPAGGSGRP